MKVVDGGRIRVEVIARMASDVTGKLKAQRHCGGSEYSECPGKFPQRRYATVQAITNSQRGAVAGNGKRKRPSPPTASPVVWLNREPLLPRHREVSMRRHR